MNKRIAKKFAMRGGNRHYKPGMKQIFKRYKRFMRRMQLRRPIGGFKDARAKTLWLEIRRAAREWLINTSYLGYRTTTVHGYKVTPSALRRYKRPDRTPLSCFMFDKPQMIWPKRKYLGSGLDPDEVRGHVLGGQAIQYPYSATVDLRRYAGNSCEASALD